MWPSCGSQDPLTLVRGNTAESGGWLSYSSALFGVIHKPTTSLSSEVHPRPSQCTLEPLPPDQR